MKYRCKNCGHDGFNVAEVISHKAVSQDGKIKVCSVRTSGIFSIECGKCFKTLTNWEEKDIIFE